MKISMNSEIILRVLVADAKLCGYLGCRFSPSQSARAFRTGASTPVDVPTPLAALSIARPSLPVDCFKEAAEGRRDGAKHRRDPWDNGEGAGRTVCMYVCMYVSIYLSCLLYTSPSPRDVEESRMPSSA